MADVSPDKLADDFATQVGENLDQFLARQKEDTRSKATLRIVNLYSICIVALVAAAAVMIASGNPNLEGLRILDEIVKGTVLPVVTFVLGFYFAGKN